ncbi:hypothetical protein LJB85_00505 [Porphyromonadaceae bacterium OttesenSCG-928-L07]|nr:hypothetical protein [Porphyromonadaceae bacterium OttesenSCG-928-L07]
MNKEEAQERWYGRGQNKVLAKEKYATHMENLMRASVGLLLRTHYNDDERSRVLESGRHSTHYGVVYLQQQ